MFYSADFDTNDVFLDYLQIEKPSDVTDRKKKRDRERQRERETERK